MFADSLDYPLVDAPLRSIACPADVTLPPCHIRRRLRCATGVAAGGSPCGAGPNTAGSNPAIRERVALVFLGASTPRNNKRNALTDSCWQSGAFDRVLMCELPHVFAYGMDSRGVARDRDGDDGGEYEGPILSQAEAAVSVRAAVYPILRNANVDTVTIVAYSMGSVLAAHLWHDFQSVCAHHFPLEKARLRAVLVGCGLTIPVHIKQVVGAFFTIEGQRARNIAADHGPNFDAILRCIREWIAVPDGPTFFIDDLGQRRDITLNPLVHFIRARDDIVYTLDSIFSGEDPYPASAGVDVSRIPYAQLQARVRDEFALQHLSNRHGQDGSCAKVHVIPGDHFAMFGIFVQYMKEVAIGCFRHLDHIGPRMEGLSKL